MPALPAHARGTGGERAASHALGAAFRRGRWIRWRARPSGPEPRGQPALRRQHLQPRRRLTGDPQARAAAVPWAGREIAGEWVVEARAVVGDLADELLAHAADAHPAH